MRDDRPFGGGAPSAALYCYSCDRRGERPAAHLACWSGILQADAHAGFGALYDGHRSRRPVTEALCCARGRHPHRHRLRRRSRDHGSEAAARLGVRQKEIASLVADLEARMRRERTGLSRHAPVAKAMDYMMKRWDGFARFLADGRACFTSNAAERAQRGIAPGRKSSLFAGSDRGGGRAASTYGLITTAKLDEVDPQARLASVLAHIAGTPASRLDDLLSWNWTPGEAANAA